MGNHHLLHKISRIEMTSTWVLINTDKMCLAPLRRCSSVEEYMSKIGTLIYNLLYITPYYELIALVLV